MQASETKLQDIIEGTKQYVVPMFQRSYSWQKNDWQLLWDDILELYESEQPYPHFMGSMVTMPSNDSLPQGVTKYVLIDGQQRLTTIFILVAVLRDQAKKSNQLKLGNELNNKFLVNEYDEGWDYYKLLPTQQDRQYFYEIIKGDFVNNKKNHLMHECYLFLEKKIRQFPELDLRKFKNIIGDFLVLVSISLGKDDNPYLVFESLNAKGQPLTQADLIRNYFFMQINQDDQDKIYQKYWLPMEQLLGDNLTEFMRHYLTKNGILVKKNEVYFKLKERVNKGDTLEYLKDIYEHSQYYANLLNPGRETNKNIRKYLTRIKCLDVATVYSFLLNCYYDWQHNKLTETTFLDVLKTIENYLLRRFACNIQTQGLNRIFASLYAQITKEIDLESATFLERLKKALQNQNYPKDSQFKNQLTIVQLYGTNRTDKGRLILESLEKFFGHKEQVSFDNLSIEHIMPQTINDEWKNHLGDDYEITHELLLHTLGNLTLTGYNSELKNSVFSVKKQELNKSHLELNKYFQNVDIWTRETMEKRGKILAEMALEIWPYFGDESLKVSTKTKVRSAIPKSLKMFKQEYPVKTWRDILVKTLDEIADYDSDKFNQILQQFPRFLTTNNQDFRQTRQLKNGIYVNVNLSSKDIYAFCQKAIEIAELSREDWEVETLS